MLLGLAIPSSVFALFLLYRHFTLEPASSEPVILPTTKPEHGDTKSPKKTSPPLARSLPKKEVSSPQSKQEKQLKEQEKLKEAFSQNAATVALIEQLYQERTLILEPALYQLDYPNGQWIPTSQVETVLNHYKSSSKSKKKKPLFLTQSGKTYLFPNLSYHQKLSLLDDMLPFVDNLHLKTGFTYIESFHWLMVLCGSPQKELSQLGCHRRAIQLMNMKKGSFDAYFLDLYSSYLRLSSEKEPPKILMIPTWRVRNKGTLENKAVPTPAEYDQKKLTFLFLLSDSNSPNAKAARIVPSDMAQEILSADLKWQPVRPGNDKILNQTYYRLALRYSISATEKNIIIINRNEKNIYKISYKTEQSICNNLASTKAVDTCEALARLNWEYAKFFIHLMSRYPNLRIPVFSPIITSSKERHLDPTDIQGIMKHQLTRLQNGQTMSLSARKLTTLEQLSADQIASIFRGANHYPRPDQVEQVTPAIFLICGFIPHEQLQNLCFSNSEKTVTRAPTSLSA